MQEICVQGKFVKKLTKKVKADLWTLDLIALDSTSQKMVKDLGYKVQKDGLIRVGGVDLPSTSGLEIKYYGYFKEGGMFACKRYEYVEPKGEQSLIKLLSSNAFKGIGRKTATELVEKLGINVLDLLKNDQLNEIEAVVGKKKTNLIKAGYQKIQGLAELQVYLMAFGVSLPTISKIWDKWKYDAIKVAKNNPFELMEVDGFGFNSANKIAESLGMDTNNPLRIRETIFYSLTNLLIFSSGDLYQKKEDVISEAENWLGKGKRDKINEEIENLANNKRIAIRSKNLLYPMFNEKAEYYTCQYALDLNEVKVEKKIKEMVRDEVTKYNKKYGKTLSEKQLQAVNKSLCNKFSIITGGPGTGKTTIIQAVIQIFKNIYGDEEITLLAPTGKAAQRMTEVCKMPARTIHSRLGIYEQDQKQTEKLPLGLVIVDESSMVDMFLAEKLFKAVEVGSYLLLVGDVDQLPSVGAGQVLNDFIESGTIPVSRLSETFRQKDGSSIIENATRINKGITNLEYNNNDFSLDLVKDEDSAINEIVDLYLKETEKEGVDNVCILCPRRRMTDKGLMVTTEYLNGVIQDKVNPLKQYEPVFEQEVDKRIIQFRVGSRVMQTKNNKDTSNGDIGVITDITDKTVKISWDSEKMTEEDVDGMKTIVLGYCLTIHKSQGSEYQSVIIPMISNQKCQLFKRNLLYTAVTRAKKKVIIVSDEEKDKRNSLINYCICNSDKNNRKTLFSLRLSTNKEKRERASN